MLRCSLGMLVVILAACGEGPPRGRNEGAVSPVGPAGMVWIPSGSFLMGSETGTPDERPVRRVEIDGFWMERTEVTNRAFAEFVERTSYVTVAERTPTPEDFPGVPEENLVPGALVFTPPAGPVDYDDPTLWWRYVPGACWRHPLGPDSDLEGLDDHPVVQVAYEDALAYARWRGWDLPTEAEWEYAARGGLREAIYPWGTLRHPAGPAPANIWQGPFPTENTALDGFAGTAPVGRFPANAWGLRDMAGNVWEWCRDWYAPDSYRRGVRRNPTGPSRSFDPQEPGVPKRVMRGGSYLCSDAYCRGFRVAARMKTSPDTGLCHLGFRCVFRPRR